MAIMLCSCGNKDKSIVGSWSLVEIHEGKHTARHGLYGQWSFTSNGQYHIEYDNEGVRYDGKYALNGRILTLNRTDGTEEDLEVEHLDQKRLIIWVAGDTKNIFRKAEHGTISEKTVTISGHVANPGKYRWRPDMTVSNLIDKAGGITARNIIIHIHTNSYGLWNAQPLPLRPGQTVYIAHPHVAPGGAMIMEEKIGE